MIRPTNQQEVEQYEIEVEKGLIGLLRTKGVHVSIGGLSEKEYFSLDRRKKLGKIDIWENVSNENRIKALRDTRKGKLPVKMELPPIIFNSTAAMPSGVPYLNVVAVSWLDKETPKNLLHSLLSSVKS